MSIYIHISVLILSLILLVDSRQNLRDYIVSHEYSSEYRREDFSVYDPKENTLLCRLESLKGYPFLNLLTYPSYQTIASIKNIWSPFLYQGYFKIFDDELNQWMLGQISEYYRPQGLRFTIKYGGEIYLMENSIGSSLINIRNEKKPNIILTRFSQIYFHPKFSSSKYHIQIYTNDLPDPIYILALYVLYSTKMRKRILFSP